MLNRNKAILFLFVFLLGMGVLTFFRNQKTKTLGTITFRVVSGEFLKPIFELHDKAFASEWESKTGQKVIFEHSYGASGDITRDVVAGKSNPDILFLNNPYELDEIANKTGLVNKNWKDELPNQSSPLYSTVSFLVRKGNPKGIKDWDDLTKPGLSLVFSNPKTCGGGRWSYTGALGYATIKYDGDEAKVEEYLSKFLKNVPIFYANQNVAGNAYLKEGLGDVLVTYENRLLYETLAQNNKSFEVVTPSSTVEITMPVAIARGNTDKNGTSDIARAYLEGIYNIDVQSLATKFYLRPRHTDIAEKTEALFPKPAIFKREIAFPTDEVEANHLNDEGFFDSIVDSD